MLWPYLGTRSLETSNVTRFYKVMSLVLAVTGLFTIRDLTGVAVFLIGAALMWLFGIKRATG
jgi:hypothetical protein